MLGNSKTIVSIDLKGVIASGAKAQLNNDALSSMFLKLEKTKCDGISININSPGGSPVQSSLIGSKIRSIASKKNIKVYAFVEDVAASGGYWLACSADEIYADNNSILGSIGVISGGFGFTGLIKKLGIEIETKIMVLRTQGAVKPLKLKATEEQIKKGAPATYDVPITFDTANFFV